MTSFKSKINIRWADIDANYHLRHSVYYDFAAQQRMVVLNEVGLSLQQMKANNFGPILFKESCEFRREILLDDVVWLSLKLSQISEDGVKWSFQQIFLNDQNEVLATIQVDGAWMDTQKRKLLRPLPEFILDSYNAMPKV